MNWIQVERSGVTGYVALENALGVDFTVSTDGMWEATLWVSAGIAGEKNNSHVLISGGRVTDPIEIKRLKAAIEESRGVPILEPVRVEPASAYSDPDDEQLRMDFETR